MLIVSDCEAFFVILANAGIQARFVSINVMVMHCFLIWSQFISEKVFLTFDNAFGLDPRVREDDRETFFAIPTFESILPV